MNMQHLTVFTILGNGLLQVRGTDYVVQYYAGVTEDGEAFHEEWISYDQSKNANTRTRMSFDSLAEAAEFWFNYHRDKAISAETPAERAA